jgi:hypothetical protein
MNNNPVMNYNNGHGNGNGSNHLLQNDYNGFMKNNNFTNNNNNFSSKSGTPDQKLLKKIRLRSIKNNKIVFCHSKKKKPVNENNAKTFELQEETIENPGFFNGDDMMIDNNEGFEYETDSIKNEEAESGIDEKTGKKPRGSRFRGVSRNGNQWQVTSI